MADVALVTPIFKYMDTVVTSFVSENLTTIINAVSPVVGLALSCTLIVECAFGLVSPNVEPLSTLMQRFLRWGIIISIASAGGMYQKTLAHAALRVPDEFANVLIMSGKTTQTGLGSMIDTAVNAGLHDAKEAFSQAGIIRGSIARGVQGVVILGTTGIICGMGAAYMIMAKVLLSICVCLGPIAIYCLLFKATTNLFGKWMGAVIHYGLITVLVAVVFGLAEKFFMNTLKQGAGSDAILPTLACVLVAVISFLIMKQVPEMASRLSDGVQVAVPSMIEAAKGGLGMARGMQSREAMKNQTASQKAIKEAVQQIAASAAGGPAAGVANAAAKAATKKAG